MPLSSLHSIRFSWLVRFSVPLCIKEKLYEIVGTFIITMLTALQINANNYSNIIFSQPILFVFRTFLEDLCKANGESTKVANCFLVHDSGFSVYNEYCTNYPRTMEVLGELTRDEKMAALFRERQIALRHALPLGSYLLKPVQRILKYHLLLQVGRFFYF